MEDVKYQGPQDGTEYPAIHLTCADGGNPDAASEIVIHAQPGHAFFEFYFGPGFLGTRQYLMSLAPGQEDRLRAFCAKWLQPAPQAPAVPTPQETYLEALRALDLALYPHKERLFQVIRKWVGKRTPNELIALIEANMDPAGSAIASPEASPQMREACEWREDDPDASLWETACGRSWVFTEGGPIENEVKFCVGCGKPVKVAPVVPEPDEDEECALGASPRPATKEPEQKTPEDQPEGGE